MAASTQPHSETRSDEDSTDTPEISVCESSPGKSVFLEAGNTEGWISSDTTTDVIR
ncbi:hypothetical protein C440_00575 [Haloferax mucosum ATCC BAA-1512]|uniref:Uncharacterized protein n=1 Tax=Haloferax mucosum ATCC BAA-1512 TaxID=662479 RepID=M0IPZ0_9EURY|nr:hypothetical protein C440_00575 [Haloferax mucosum ATCC BAA-1512]